MEPEVAGLIDFSSLDLGGIEPVDLDIQNAYSSWLSEGNTGSLSDFTAATSETTPTDLTDMGAGSDTDAATIAPPGLLASVLDPKPMIGLATPKADNPAPPASIPESGIRATPFAPLFVEKASEYGISPRYLDRTAAVESRYDPNAQNPRSSAGGLFQFINGTARDYNLANRFDPVQATDAAARLARDNAATLKNALGRDPTDGELYLAHQQGAGGAIKILSNPDAPMESLVGSEAARLNGGAGLTGSQFAQKFISKIEGGASAFAPSPNAGRAPQSYDDRMASIGAQRIPADGFIPVQPGDLPAVPDATGMRFNDQPGLLGGLLDPNPTNRTDGQPRMQAIPGATDPRYLYENPAGTALPRAPEPTARDMVAGARTGGARPASIARDNRADSPAVRSATVSTTGGRALNPVMQEDFSNAPDGGARQFAAMEASRGGPFSMFGGGQEPPQAATGGAVPALAGDVPAAGSAPVQSASGGATAAPASGGGWKMSDTMSDFFMALGSSLLSSPKGRPLQNFGQAFNALTVASQDRQKTAGQVNATALMLRRAGVPEADIPVLSVDPRTAAGYVEQMRAMKTQADEAAYRQQLYGGGPTPTTAPERDAVAPPSVPAPQSSGQQPTGAPQPEPQQSSQPAPAQAPPAGEAERQRLRAEIANFERIYGAAPTDNMRAQTKFQIDRREARLKELGDPLDKRAKELSVIKAERDLAGEGAVPISQEERASLGIGPGQAAYRTRSGEIKFGPAGTKIEMPGQEREFDKEAGKAVAKRFEAMATEGDAARQDRALIGQLRSLGGKIGNMGAGAALQGRLAEWGVKVGDNVSEIEAYNAIVDKLTPQQRVPGTGASSDKDIGLFKSSLPSLVRTPEGNALVIDTLDAVAADKEARAAIAEKALFKEMTPTQAVESLRALPDPLARFKEMQAKGAKNGGGAGSTVRPDGSSPPTPSTAPDRAAVEAELRRRQLLK